MDNDSPYGRVTDPGRYAVLHQAAQELIADLVERHDLTVTALEPEMGHQPRAALSTTRLEPDGPGATVVVTLTGFPGLWVTFGARHEESFPSCGCDACDEEPGLVLEDFMQKVHAVAEGRFEETRTGFAFTFADGSYASGDNPRAAPLKPMHYPAWPKRPLAAPVRPTSA